MSLHKQQMEILKKYFYNVEQTTENRFSCLIIGVENTIFSAETIKQKLRLGISSATLTKAYQRLENKPEYAIIHQQNVENLKKKGFRFI
jgi:hypothetical protein